MKGIEAVIERTVAWAEEFSEMVLKDGRKLTNEEMQLAESEGVLHPECIRVMYFNDIKIPEESTCCARDFAELGGKTIAALSLGYGIALRRDISWNRDLLSHEFRHTVQFERLGGLRQFIGMYMLNLEKYGYKGSPMETGAGDVSLLCNASDRRMAVLPEENIQNDNREVSNSSCMDIYSESGTKVKFKKNWKPVFLNWWPGFDDPRGKLVAGVIYTVSYTDVHSDYTKVYLEEVEGAFNSVWFARVD